MDTLLCHRNSYYYGSFYRKFWKHYVKLNFVNFFKQYIYYMYLLYIFMNYNFVVAVVKKKLWLNADCICINAWPKRRLNFLKTPLMGSPFLLPLISYSFLIFVLLFLLYSLILSLAYLVYTAVKELVRCILSWNAISPP